MKGNPQGVLQARALLPSPPQPPTLPSLHWNAQRFPGWPSDSVPHPTLARVSRPSLAIRQ